MVSYFVRYRGAASRSGGVPRPTTSAQHAAMLRQFPDIRSLVLHRPRHVTDPFPVRHGETMLLAQMQFDSASDLDAALRSPARQAARDDFHRFPPFRRRSDA